MVLKINFQKDVGTQKNDNVFFFSKGIGNIDRITKYYTVPVNQTHHCLFCRRLYVKKCGQLFDEKAVSEVHRMDQLTSAKETMKVTINQDFVSIYIVVRRCAWNELQNVSVRVMMLPQKKKIAVRSFSHLH